MVKLPITEKQLNLLRRMLSSDKSPIIVKWFVEYNTPLPYWNRSQASRCLNEIFEK